LTLLRPPSATLFPYTTLFRSPSNIWAPPGGEWGSQVLPRPRRPRETPVVLLLVAPEPGRRRGRSGDLLDRFAGVDAAAHADDAGGVFLAVLAVGDDLRRHGGLDAGVERADEPGLVLAQFAEDVQHRLGGPGGDDAGLAQRVERVVCHGRSPFTVLGGQNGRRLGSPNRVARGGRG